MKISCFLLVVSFFVCTMAGNDLLTATEVSNGNTKFTSNLYQILAKEPGNVFFSPISAHAVLSMIYQGASGATAEALRKNLYLPEVKATATGYKNIMTELNSVENVTLHIANKVYIANKYQLNDNFKLTATKDYLAEAQPLDFKQSVVAAKEINTWVENKTNNKIKDLIQPDDLDELTRLVLVNAIYFKGNWLHQFPVEHTRKEKFYLNDKDSVLCDMMHLTDHFEYAEDTELDAKILRMRYTNKDVSMVIVLPNSKTGIFALEQKLANKDLTTLTSQLVSREVIVSLPKFKIETTIDLKDSLEKLGMGVIFSDAAEFPNLIKGDEPLKVSKAIQKAFIEVNEQGAEAAAATVAVFKLRTRPQFVVPKPEFIADHPFLFITQFHGDNDITINLFFGSYLPNKEFD
ncbi:serine protease inhibitor 3/4-like isoform X7 [Onthophagus taurus]|uniref:serine protease inhibitor 3/4-like isoform X7 n=1 Tax=Onthophagus taurus TaxID=166361 RepID=UPI0039BE11F4